MSLPAAAALRDPDVPALTASAAPALSFRKALRSTIVLPIISADEWAGFVIVFERRVGDARSAQCSAFSSHKGLSCRVDATSVNSEGFGGRLRIVRAERLGDSDVVRIADSYGAGP